MSGSDGSTRERLQHFFVYGTLKRGQCRESMWPVEPISVQQAWVRGMLYAGIDYPALMEGHGRVAGELWECPEQSVGRVLEVLDAIEGTNGNQPGDLYHRKVVDVFADGESPTPAYTYFYNRDPLRDGFWLAKQCGSVQAWPEKHRQG